MKSLGVLLLISISLASCTSKEGTSALDQAVAKASADSLWNRYALAINQPDSADLSNLFTIDAKVDFAGRPTAFGLPGIKASLDSVYHGFDATGFRVRPDVFNVSNALAVQSGEFEEDGNANGTMERRYGRYVLVMVLGESGAWRASRLTGMVDSIRPLP